MTHHTHNYRPLDLNLTDIYQYTCPCGAWIATNTDNLFTYEITQPNPTTRVLDPQTLEPLRGTWQDDNGQGEPQATPAPARLNEEEIADLAAALRAVYGIEGGGGVDQGGVAANSAELGSVEFEVSEHNEYLQVGFDARRYCQEIGWRYGTRLRRQGWLDSIEDGEITGIYRDEIIINHRGRPMYVIADVHEAGRWDLAEETDGR